ncbi:MAG: hypothetical protein KDC98_08975, partial [Planctomycetes bacterium]|nr:hypothetical protein [Planctomycetota bacterium]
MFPLLLAAAVAQGGVDGSVHREDLLTHYANVERELRAAPAPADPTLAARRAEVLDLLHEYRTLGRFGIDSDDLPRRRALFVDDGERRCAVAFLLDHTGRADLTDTVRERCNGVWVAELAEVPELASWLAERGLTLAEAARIQGPSRSRVNTQAAVSPPPPPPEPPTPPEWQPEDGAGNSPTGTGTSRNGASTRSSPVPASVPTGTPMPARSVPRGAAMSFDEVGWKTWWNWNRDHFTLAGVLRPQPTASATAAIDPDLTATVQVLRELCRSPS